MRRGKGEPADKEPDRVICGFRYGVQKRNILCPDRFDIVQESSDEEEKKGNEKGKRKKQIGKDQATNTENDSVKKQRRFFDFALHQRPVALGRMMEIKGGIGYFIYDVIDGGDGPSENEGEQASAAEK